MAIEGSGVRAQRTEGCKNINVKKGIGNISFGEYQGLEIVRVKIKGK